MIVILAILFCQRNESPAQLRVHLKRYL